MVSEDDNQRQILLEQFERRVTVYADELRMKVQKKSLSRHLAGLLLQKFGQGFGEAADIVLGKDASFSIVDATEKLVAEIDPAWHEHAIARAGMKPAGISEGLG